MNKFQLLSLIGSVALLSACGNQAQNPAAYTYGYGAQTGYYNNGYNTGGYNNGNYNAWNTSTPLYQGNQVIGYKTRQPLFAGVYSNITSGIFTQTAGVNAGDRLSVNAASIQWAAYIFCDRKFLDGTTTKHGIANNAIVTLNGQPISGSVVAPAAGNVAISIDTTQFDISCGAHGDRPFQILNLAISLGGQNNSYYNQTPTSVVSVERCTNTAGAAIACPY